MSPAVSVILPTFNRPEYLGPALESVFAQTFTDWELLIADDGSDTATRVLLRGISKPPRVRVIWLAHSGKPGVARNAALREACGDYVAFLDSDDLWLPDKLDAQMASLRRHASCGWSYTRFGVIDASGRRLCVARSQSWPAPSGWILEKILKEETVIALPSVVVARELLLKLGAFDEALVMCEDDELWLRLASHSEADGIDAPLTLVRRHAAHSGSDIIAWQDRARVMQKALLTSIGMPHEPLLRKLRAGMAAGLARSQAGAGKRSAVLATLFSSVPYSWRYAAWWKSASVAMGRAYAPRFMHGLARRYRQRYRAPQELPRP